MRIRNAFTMIELIFVIVIMGIIGQFGTEFIAQSYNNFIYSKINNNLHSKSTSAVEFIATRLQYRIKDSVIARKGKVPNFTPLVDASGSSFTVLEWVATDIEGFRGERVPYWSGIIDLDMGNQNLLVSLQTDTSEINDLIKSLSYDTSDIKDIALYFIGSNNFIDGYGWDGNAIIAQNEVMHPVKPDPANVSNFIPRIGGTQTTNSLTGVDVYEYYKLAWTANAIVMEYDDTKEMGDLYFYYNYQPWDGEKFYDPIPSIQKSLIMEGVSTFQAMALGSVIKIQVCTKSLLVDGTNDSTDISTKGYSLCKEKTIF